MTTTPPHPEPGGEKRVVRQHFDGYAAGWHQRLDNHVYATRFGAVERLMRGLPVTSVLDVGCGTGDYCRLIDSGTTRYLGIDFSKPMIAECRRLYPRCEFQVADGEALPAADGQFDLVLNIGVLEYYEDPLPHLQELARVVRPNGSVIVAVPNGSNRSRRLERAWQAAVRSRPVLGLRRLLGRPGAVRGAASGPGKDARIQHRSMTADRLDALGRRVGLTLRESRYVGLLLVPEATPLFAQINDRISRRLAGRPGWTWLSKPTAQVLVVRLEKAAAAAARPIAGSGA